MNLYTAEFLVKEQVADRLREADQARLVRTARCSQAAVANVTFIRLRRLVARVAPAT